MKQLILGPALKEIVFFEMVHSRYFLANKTVNIIISGWAERWTTRRSRAWPRTTRSTRPRQGLLRFKWIVSESQHPWPSPPSASPSPSSSSSTSQIFLFSAANLCEDLAKTKLPHGGSKGSNCLRGEFSSEGGNSRDVDGVGKIDITWWWQQ